MAVVNKINLQALKIKNLPEIPTASLKIIDAVNNPEISIDELANVISVSPVLTARLLGLANSAYFGCSVPIKDLKTAVIRVLGLNLVKSLTLGILLNLSLDTSQCSAFRSEKLWMSALVLATVAQRCSMVLNSKSIQPSTSYTCGLFLNIGLVAAVHLYPKETNLVLNLTEQNRTSVSHEMTSIIDYNQFEIGGYLLKYWRLPTIYQTVLKEFKNPNFAGEEKEFISFIGLCYALSKKIIVEQQGYDFETEIVQMEKIGLAKEKIRSIVTDISAKKETIYLAALAISGN